MRHVMTILRTLNKVTIAMMWLIIIVLGILTTTVAITVMSIAWSINAWAGLGFLGLILLVVWMMFYVFKH